MQLVLPLLVLFLPQEGSFAREVEPVLVRNCFSCHSRPDPSGELDLVRHAEDALGGTYARLWREVRVRLATGEMPPRTAPDRPSPEEVRAVVEWIDANVPPSGDPSEEATALGSGRVTLRRLNRDEYRHAVLDLLGVDYRTRELLPPDGVGQGFDVVGEVLSMPPVLFERLFGAAERVAEAALPRRATRDSAGESEGDEDPAEAPPPTSFEVRFRTANFTAAEIVPELAGLLWRGEVASDDVAALLALAGEDATDRERLRGALVALLASPRFLFRVEPAPTESASRALTGSEVATRLAAFLWNSVPDAELLEGARRGALATRAGRHAQVERMLLDARSSRLATAFAVQWLQLGRLSAASPDPRRFPTFDETLRASMQAEVELFFDALVRERRPVSELVTADFTFVDERLARHYGIAGVEGSRFVRVRLPAELAGQRGGLLGMAGLLTATSNPTRTSPVLRGKWVLEALLATPPPPPPPGVGALDESREAVAAASLRERLEAHRAEPSCAACHAPMDGLGFVLENYDAVGAWREKDGTFPIDASGTLPGGRTLEGREGLARVLLADDALLHGLVRHLATFALGRGLVVRDEPALEALVVALPEDPTLADVIHGIVELEGFLRRYREEP